MVVKKKLLQIEMNIWICYKQIYYVAYVIIWNELAKKKKANYNFSKVFFRISLVPYRGLFFAKIYEFFMN